MDKTDRRVFLGIFLAGNSLAILCALYLWTSSSMMAGFILFALWALGTLGTFFGATVVSMDLYSSAGARWIFRITSTALFVLIACLPLWVKYEPIVRYESEEHGQYVAALHHEQGVILLYLLISSAWMLVETTRSKRS